MRSFINQARTLLSILETNKIVLNVIIPLFILFVNLVLKFRYISFCPIAGDEPFSIFISQMNVPSIIKVLSEGNNPPLFEIILHYWTKLFGISPVSVRFLPCIFSCLTAVVIYKIGLNFFRLRIAILSVLLFTLSNYQMYFSHETRVYSLLLLLSTLSFYAYMSILKYEAFKYRIIHIASLILIPYAHYLGFFILFIQLFLTLAIPQLRKLGRVYFINLLIAFVFYIPIFTVFFQRFYESAMHGTWLAPVRNIGQLLDIIKLLLNDNVTSTVLFMFIVWLSLNKGINNMKVNSIVKSTLVAISIFYLLYSLSIMMPMPHFYKFTGNAAAIASYIIVLIICMTYLFRSESISVYARILLAWVMLPLLIMFVSSFWIPMFLDRYLIFFTSAFYVLVALMITFLDKSKIPGISLLVIFLMGITFTRNPDNKRQVVDAINKVKELKTPNTVVYMCPDYFDMNFAYYYNRSLFSDIEPANYRKRLRDGLAKENIYPIASKQQIDTFLIKKTNKVIYIDAAADFSYPQNKIKAYLDSCMNPVQDNFYYEIFHVIEYRSKENGEK
ncbi:MAG TPA: glycosyltransferase family 39 protein [Bacteroidales bacterium]|nr:glycosyltransferase family 39 protein [Bacteroidales bacterium]